MCKKTLYHGSSEVFDNFKINEKLAKHDIQSVLPEGIGIYMTEKKEIANSYGGDKIYKVELNEKDILDFTTIKNCKKIIKEFLKINDTEGLLINCNDTVDGIVNDRISIMKCLNDIVLYNEEYVYSVINDNFNFYEYEEKIFKSWNNYINKHCLKYNSNDLGVVYIAKNADILKIISVESN